MASDGGGKLKLKRPQSASKPYERRKSLYRKVTDTVKDLLSPSWLPDILATVKKSPPKQSHNTITIDEEEDEEEMFMNPQASNQMNSYNGPPQIGLASKLENKLPAPQPKRSKLPVNTTVQSYNRKQTFTSSRPNANYTPSQPTTSSRYSLDNNSVTRPPIRREERPSSTRTSSGLSGLPVSQPEEGLALSEDKIQKLRDDFSSEANKAGNSNRTSVIESTGQHHRSSDISTTFNMEGQSKRPRIWGHEIGRTAVPRPVEPAVRERPAFKASLFGSSMMETSLLGDETLNESSFYSGKTTFGGSSALRNRSRLNVTAPYQTALPIRKQMKPKLANNSFSAVTSSSARRILESLERMSTPLSDVKKIPMESPSVSDSLLSFTPSSYRRQSFQPSLLSRRSLEVPSRSGPPTSQIRTHSIASISRNRQTSTPISSRTTSIHKQTIQESQGENTIRTDASSISKNMPKSRLEDNIETPIISYSNKTSGKMKRDKTHHYSSKKQDIEDEIVEIPSLKSDFTLPVGNLPQIQFTATPIGKVDDLTAKTIVESSHDLKYTFSSPIHQPQKPLTVTSPVGKVQGFTFSSPLKADDDSTVRPSQTSATIGYSFVSSTPSTAPKPKSMLGNGGIGFDFKPSPIASTTSEKSSPSGFQSASNLKQGSVMDILGGNKSTLKQGSVMDVLGKKTTSSSPLKQGSVMDILSKKDSSVKKTDSSSGVSLAQLFSKPAGTWTCDTCMIENNAEKTKCAACETPKPSSKPTGRLIASEKSVTSKTTSDTDKPSLSSLFNQQAGSWSCDVCMVQNKPDTDKCAACETPKPGAKPATTENKSLATLFAKKAGSWDCDVCMVQNKPDVEKCVACETPKPGSKSTGGLKSSVLSTGTSSGTGQLTSSGFKFSSNDTSASSASGFKFGTSSSDNNTSASSGGGGFKFDGGKDSTPTTGGFKFPGTSTTDSKCVFGGATVPSEQSTTSGFSFGNKDTTEPKQGSGFGFGNTNSLESKQVSGLNFGNKDTTTEVKPISGFNVTNQDKSSGTGFTFGNPVQSSETDNSKVNATGGFTFGAQSDSSKLGENKNSSEGGIQFNSGVKTSSDNSQLNGKSVVGGFVFGETNKIKETNNNDLEKAKSENKGGFGQSNPAGGGIGSVGGFTFGASKLEQPKVNSIGGDSSIFAFGGGAPATSNSGGLGVFPSSTPFINSGKRSIEEDTNEPASKKVFSFGGAGGTTAAPVTNGPFQFGASTEAKPTALVQPENKTPSFNFNAGGNSGFNFNTKPAETKPQPSAVFSFGAGNSTTPAMAFGGNTSTAPAFGTGNSTAPSFGAGNTTSTFGNSNSTSGFGNANNSFSGAPAAFGSFGGNGSTSGSNQPTPAFGASSATPAFGAAGQTPSFGNSTTSFGAPATNNAGFNFNATPNLSFGSGTGASTFQFNAKTNDSGSATTAQTPQTSAFVFGAQTAPQAAPTPGFSAPTFGTGTAFSIGTSDSGRKIKKAVRRKK